ncbi:MAG: cytochrome d ubiquinol oxidase subunit II, partial [Thermodesulfobacteriota bacterium]
IDLSGVAEMEQRLRKAVWSNFLCSLPFLVYVLGAVLIMKGFHVAEDGTVSRVAFKYFSNLLALPHLLVMLLAGLGLVILGVLGAAFKGGTRGIWPAGLGTVLVGLCVLCLPAFNSTSFYPSKFDLQSSLTIYNASSSQFTLTTMTYVALGIPFVLAYIAYLWKQMDSKKLTSQEAMDHEAY